MSYVDPCESSPCLNDGRCNEIEDGAYLCYCSPGWIGKNCHISKFTSINSISFNIKLFFYPNYVN